jgi:hypothetical protein
MASPTPFVMQHINPASRSKELGLFPYCGGYIDSTSGIPKNSSDDPAPAFKYLVVRGTDGDIVVETFDGKYDVIPACTQGSWKMYAARKVVIGAVTINGNSYETTATDIWWKGGVGAG